MQGRDLALLLQVMERLNAAGASFVSATQNFSTADATGRLTMNMSMSFAEFEREMISGSTGTTSARVASRPSSSPARTAHT